MGYHQAGFDEIIGVDNRPQPRYPFQFVQADALEYVRDHGAEFDAIHASPPCQGYSRMRHLPWLKNKTYPMLIDATRRVLIRTERPYVIENVMDAPLNGGVLCGAALGLPLSRHRRFESNVMILYPPCPGHPVIAHGAATMATKYRGHGIAGVYPGYNAEESMGIDWMTRAELAEAIPPAYTRFIGGVLLN